MRGERGGAHQGAGAGLRGSRPIKTWEGGVLRNCPITAWWRDGVVPNQSPQEGPACSPVQSARGPRVPPERALRFCAEVSGGGGALAGPRGAWAPVILSHFPAAGRTPPREPGAGRGMVSARSGPRPGCVGSDRLEAARAPLPPSSRVSFLGGGGSRLRGLGRAGHRGRDHPAAFAGGQGLGAGWTPGRT